MSRGVAAAISMVTQPNFADSFVSSISGVAASSKMQVDAAHTPKGRRLRRATPTQRDALDRKRASVPLRGGCARLGFRLRKSFRGARTPEHGLVEIDGLVNCVAIVVRADPLESSEAVWEKIFRVNLFSAYDASRRSPSR